MRLSRKPRRRIRPVPRHSAGKGLGTSLAKVLVHCLGGTKTLVSNFGLGGAKAPHKTLMWARTEDHHEPIRGMLWMGGPLTFASA